MIVRPIALALVASAFNLVPIARAQATASEAPGSSEVGPKKPLSQTLAIYKRMTLEQLMDQEVISVAKSPQAYRDAPASIQVVTDDDIRRFGASSFPEALRLADSLYVAQASSSQWHISARGFNASVGNKLLVLMDGRTIYSPLFSGVIWNMQDYLMADLDRIEVVSGPGGTLWGANAVNGVINIVSKDARDTQGLYAEAGGGTWLEDFVGVRYGGTLASNVFYRVYGKYFDRGAQVFSDGSSAHDAWNRGQGGIRLDSNASAQDLLTFDGGGFVGNNDVVPGGQGAPEANGNSSGGHALGRWTHTFHEDTDMSFQVYYDHTHLTAPFQSAGSIPGGDLNDHLDTVDLDFQHRFPVGDRQRIIWGGEYRFTHDVAESAPLVAFLPEHLDQNLFSAFLQDEIRLHDTLWVTLGSKVEHNDYTGVEFEPSARVQWNVQSDQMLWAAISRAVRTPARYDRDLFEPHPAYSTLVVGNDSFLSETVIAYELGYRAALSSRASASITGYYNDYDRLRTLNLTDTGAFHFENNLRGHTYGAELSANYQLLDWWRLHAGYDFIEEHLTVHSRGDLNAGLNETADPKHQVFFRSSMDLPAHLEFDAALRWIAEVSNNSLSTVGTIPSYAELDLRLAWHPIPSVELAVVGQNLIHDQHPEAGFPGPEQEEITRSVYAKVTWRF